MRSTASRPSYTVGHCAHGAGFGSGGALPQVGWLPTNTIAGPPAAAAVIAADVAALPLLSAAYTTVTPVPSLVAIPWRPVIL